MSIPLLPQPAHIRLKRGTFHLPGALPVFFEPLSRLPHEPLPSLLTALRNAGCHPVPDCMAHYGAGKTRHILLECQDAGDREDYRIEINPDRIEVWGAGRPGFFYAIQTLIQIIRARAPDLPLLDIVDRPVFRHRGYYYDISRGKVPKMETLKLLVDRLAALKINQLQLYFEHVFDFRFDPAIGHGCDPITADEIRELDHYCRERCIELVPSLTCFGHMGRVLSLPAYRRLAELEWPARDWARATWQQRLRGATLNPSLVASRRLLRRMTNEFLPLFSSHHFNMCGDETYDLGRGRRHGRWARMNTAELYLEHLKFVRGLAERHGKRLMFWGDVMLHHPQAIAGIPRDCIALDWGYHPETDFKKTRLFLRAGLEAYVCPSVRGYKVVFNEVEEARANIAGYARTGARLGALGLLNTDWGDMGHFNMPACSLHGMALGAALAWNPAADSRRSFDRAFAAQVFGDFSGTVAKFFRHAGATGLADWPLPAAGLREYELTPMRVRAARRLADQPAAWAKECRSWPPRALVGTDDLLQLAIACRAIQINIQWVRLEARRLAAGRITAQMRRAADQLIASLHNLDEEFSNHWKKMNRPSGLMEIRRRVFRKAAMKLQRHYH